MKKIYTMFFASVLSVASMAQATVTFNVDMNQQTVSPDGVHIAGNFADLNYDGNLENPSYVNWSPTAYQLSDVDMDGVYSFSFDLVPGAYEFKFINGNNWPFEEVVPNACRANQSGNSNRILYVFEDATSYDVCFGACAACGSKTALFRVDANFIDTDGDGTPGELGEDISPLGIHVAGDWQNPQWQPNTHPLNDFDGDGIWSAVYPIADQDVMQFKFINGNDWVDGIPESVSGSCAAGDNRQFDLTEDNTVLPVYCWNSCDPCVQPSMITFQVNMSVYCGDLSEGVNLMGTATNWSSGEPMSDSDGDGIYTLTLPLQPGAYEFKFRVGGNGWEGVGNRPLTVEQSTDATLDAVCFSSMEPCGQAFDPADVLFRVNPGTNEVPVGQVLWVMGDFTGWQSGALTMTDDDGDGIWERLIEDFCPQEGFFKFVIGADNTQTGTNWTEETADFSELEGACGVNNPGFSDNRKFVRPSADAMEICFTFNTCGTCLVGVDETTVVESLKVFPNPAQDILNVSFESLVAQNVVINVINNLGQIVMTQNLGNVVGQRTVQMNVNNLSTGVYAIQISNGSSTQVERVTVK